MLAAKLGREEVLLDTSSAATVAAPSTWKLDQLMLASLGMGVAIGLVAPVDEALPEAVQRMSCCLGWACTAAWTVSFYPQVLENRRRRSVVGLSPDFLLYSLLGFSCYAAYTGSLYFNGDIQGAYAAAHAGAKSDVQLSDFLFAAHAVVISLYVLWQSSVYESKGQQLSTTAAGVSGGLVLFGAALLAHVQSTCPVDDCGAWLGVLMYLGGVKVLMTVIKYTPQALLNHERRSTDGWQIDNVLLDLTGAGLSLTQIVLDAAARADWSVITGNPAKLGISGISIGFDLLFIAQHYVFYRDSQTKTPSSLSAAANDSVFQGNNNNNNSGSNPFYRAVPVLARAHVPLKSAIRRVLRR